MRGRVRGLRCFTASARPCVHIGHQRHPSIDAEKNALWTITSTSIARDTAKVVNMRQIRRILFQRTEGARDTLAPAGFSWLHVTAAGKCLPGLLPVVLNGLSSKHASALWRPLREGGHGHLSGSRQTAAALLQCSR
jgi:hypothetical protein